MDCLLVLNFAWPRYRLNEEKAEWIIYVTDVGQQQHFNMFFKVGLMNILLFLTSCEIFSID